MQVLDRGIFLKLKALAKSRGVTVQELIRVLVIPDWMRKSQEEYRRTEERRRHRRLAGAGARAGYAVATVRRGGPAGGGSSLFAAGGERGRAALGRNFSGPFLFVWSAR